MGSTGKCRLGAPLTSVSLYRRRHQRGCSEIPNRRVGRIPSPAYRDFSGLGKIVIAVRDLDSAVDHYHQAYGTPPPIKQVDAGSGAHLALLGGAPVILAQPLTHDPWLARRMEEFGEAPCAFLLAVRRGHYPVSRVRWFGADVQLIDADKLGRRLVIGPPRVDLLSG